MDSPLLTRSISYPTHVSRDSNKEGNPYSALSESISFGRYMTESLSWEKYSSFSHNRYLEEAEKYSKPGSVAQMKAYFEAHFKKRAALKTQTQTLPITPQPSINHSYVIAHDCANEPMDNHLVHTPVVEIERDNSLTKQVESIETVESPVSISMPLENVNKREENVPVQEENTPATKERSKMEKFTSSLKKKLRNSFSKSSVSKGTVKSPMFPAKLPTSESGGSKISVTPLLKKSGRDSNGAPDIKKFQGDSNGAPDIKKFQGDSNGAPDIKKFQGDSNGAPNIKKPGGDYANGFPDVKKPGGDYASATTPVNKKSGEHLDGRKRLFSKSLRMSVNEKSGEHLDGRKRLLSKSLRMSVNFGSHANPESRTTLAKDCLTPSQTQMRVFPQGTSKHPPKILQSEDEKMKIPVSESVPGRVKADGKQKSLNLVPLKSPSTRGSKSPSPVKFCPFNFMTDERAAKRKEFHQKLQEKTQLQESDKVTKPELPKLRRKFSRPPHMPSVNSEISKHIILLKNKQRTTHSATSLPRKSSTRENFSPNIQR